MSKAVYIQMKKRVRLPKGEPIYLGQVAHLLAPDDEQQWKYLPVGRFSPGNRPVMMVEWMDVARVVKERQPDWDIRQVGPSYTLVEALPSSERSRMVWALLVWLLLFIGSGLAIMNFHADVSMLKVHQRMYYLLTGTEIERPLILQIPYSLGIGLGMAIFFNHLWKRKFNDEPTPLELEMFLYQENIDQFVVDQEKSKRSKGHESSG